MMQKVRFFTTISTLYLLTIGVIGYLVYPSPIFGLFTREVEAKSVPVAAPAETAPAITVFSGKPTRVVIPDYGIDLVVDDGHYNETDGSWTLSNTHAQYAMMTTPANNIGGNTLIYGHATDQVFGKLASKIPAVGTRAEIYTDTDHVFVYHFTDSRNLTPQDTSILSESNRPATMTIQTCTGIFNEWRTMYRFQFVEMLQ